MPGYTQTYHDAFDTYVYQQHQDDASPSPEFHFTYLFLPTGFSVTARQETPTYAISYFADAWGVSSNKLYLQHSVLLI